MSMIEQLEKVRGDAHQGASEQYREIIQSESSSPDDAARLAELAQELGLSDDDVAGDVYAVARMREASGKLLGNARRQELQDQGAAAVAVLDGKLRDYLCELIHKVDRACLQGLAGLAYSIVRALPDRTADSDSEFNTIDALFRQIMEHEYDLMMTMQADDRTQQEIAGIKQNHPRIFGS